MKKAMRYLLFLITIFFAANSFSQRGKDGNYTSTGMDEVLNSYTYLTVDAAAGATTINVSSGTMNNAFFGGNLQAGDLLFIHQIQGGDLLYSDWYIFNWGVDWTAPLDSTWGNVTAYNNSGNHEFVEVQSVSGNTITLNCALQSTYHQAANVVVTRVPRIIDLTVPNGTSITASNWDGNEGGEVILEISGDLDVQFGGQIDANGKGFRGGDFENSAGVGFYGLSAWGLFTTDRAGRKGESISGYETEYNTYSSEYGKGAPTNGGGGGNGHNSGGGGGANAGFGTYYSGKGVPDPTYASSWDLEYIGFSGNPSNGGGRGGYTSSGAAGDPENDAPGDGVWGSDNRREEGGRGGHILDYSLGKIWFGGGGGAGDGNDNEGGAGGAGGGVVYILAYGAFTGDGDILANGENGENSQGGVPGGTSISGDDGAGGAGAGGVVMINSVSNVPNSLNVSVEGGTGGDNFIQFSAGAINNNFTCGPGGGGSGGYIAISGGSPTLSAAGGANGISTGKPVDTEFPPNGATSGNTGITSGSLAPFDIDIADDTICGGGDITLTATIIGTLPSGATGLTWWDSEFGGAVIGTGNSTTLTGLSSNTTVYVGTCPGTFRKEVNIIVSPAIVISGTATITNTTCNGSTGSITGLTASGGAGTLVFDWNGTASASEDLLNASPNSYTLTVTDDYGCTETSGPYTINAISGPSIDSSNYVITPESCAGGDGSITGITSTGTATLTYEWNTTSYPDEEITDASTGVYWLYVTDGNGCIDSTGPYNMTQVAGPSIDSLSYVITNSACNGNTGGVSGITATGIATLTYEWNGAASAGPDLVNAGVGTYMLVVTDGNGCKDSTGLYTVGQQNPPVIDSLNYVITNTACDTDNGSITGITTTGNSPFAYEWNGVSSVSEDATGLAVGTYTLHVTDVNGCVDSTGTYSIIMHSPPTIDSINYSIVNTACDADNGQISGIVASGNTPFVFEWNGVVSADEDITGLGLGDYTLVVTDVNGCVDSTGLYTIGQQTPPVIDSTSYVISDRSCIGDDATITGITVSGNSPYEFYWNNILTGSINASNLGLGDYTLVVVDVNGCSDTSGVYTVTQAPDPSIDSTGVVILDSDCNSNTGSVSGITVSGFAPFVYLWNGVAGNLDETGLAPGLHELIVVDANGCDDTLTGINVGTLNGPIIDDTNLSTEDDHCSQSIGSILGLTVSAGTAGYTYLWDNGAGSALDAMNLDSNIYQLTVTDAAGCTAFYGPVSIGNIQGPSIIETSLSITDDFCDLNNGIVTGITANGESPFNYLWSNGDTTLALVGVGQGDYSLIVTDNFGCSSTSSLFTVGNSNPNPIDFTWNPNPVTTLDSDVTFTGVNTSPSNSFWWDFDIFGSATDQDPVQVVMDQIGVYNVCLGVNFSPGCADTICHEIIISGELIIPNVITANGDGMNDEFRIEGLLPNTKVTIVNRWGNLIYETDNYDNQWDGIDRKGLLVSDGEYFYVIVDPLDETYQGSVRIITK
jgi:gliding motility-associated-like protein